MGKRSDDSGGTMRRSIGRGVALAGIATLALGLTVGGATAANGKGHAWGKLAAKQCSKQKKEIGQEAFNELYGKPSQPNCIGVVRGHSQDAAQNAAKECKAQGMKGKEFGKCVSAAVKSEANEESANVINAARACRTERDDPTFAAAHGGMTFDQFYGSNLKGKTGKNGAGRNAFGKCVSGKVHAA